MKNEALLKVYLEQVSNSGRNSDTRGKELRRFINYCSEEYDAVVDYSAVQGWLEVRQEAVNSVGLGSIQNFIHDFTEWARLLDKSIGRVPKSGRIGEKGDAIQHERNLRQQVRIFNEEALCKGLLKASEIADQSGVAIQPVSLKFLAQWSEGVSLEEPKDDSLLDLWAKLLASESVGQGRNSLVFIDILKKLDRSHAEYMSGMFTGNAHMLTESNDYFGEMAYEDLIVSKLQESGLPDKNPSDEDEVIKSLYDALRLPGTYNFALYVNEVRDEKKELELSVPPVDIDFNSRPVSMHSTISDVLEALGLVEKFHHEFPWHSPHREFEISMYSKKLTPLGWEFVLSCGVIKLEKNEVSSNE